MNMLIPPIRLALPIVDAGVHQYFITEQNHPVLTARRQMLTLGSVRYTFSLAGSEIASVTLRSVGTELTTVSWGMSEATRLQRSEIIHQIEDLIRNQFWGFKQWIANDVENTTNSIGDWEAHITKMVNWFISPEDVAAKLKNDGGRPTPEEDMWAWEEIHIRKQPPQTVRDAWKERVKANTGRHLSPTSYSRTFNKLLDPEWSPAKKKHGSIV